MQDIKNIIIVGGGTAGWLSALFLRKRIPYSNITVIESSEYGILGAGEGTTPHFIDLIRNLDINIDDLFKYAKATIKNGIKFTNWNGDGESYFHPFEDRDSILNNVPDTYYCIAKNKNLDDYVLSSTLGNEFKTKLRYSYGNREESRFNNLESLGTVALHFDARDLALYLKTIGVERGVNIIDGIVNKVIDNKDGYITQLELKDGQVIDSDFVIDCSGFRRLLIGGHFNAPWRSYADSIPNNRAIPFFIENKSQEIPPYTESIAMKYGWVWKIPVQGRFGCGYVFDSKKITDEEAKAEIKEQFGEVNFPTVFNFDAGCYTTPWVKNCLAIGLSAGFIEPLEATSIWVQILSLRKVLEHLSGMAARNEHSIQAFNYEMLNINEDILSFIYLHYITKRTDTDYWESFREKNNPPAKYLQIEKHNKNIISRSVFNELMPGTFGQVSMLAVGTGVKIFPKPVIDEYINSLEKLCGLGDMEDYLHERLSYNKYLCEHALDHYKLIRYLRHES